MVQEYYIEGVTKEVKQTGQGKPYSGLKIDGKWVNIEGDMRWMKGTTQSLELKQNGKWTWAKRGPQPSQQEQANGAPGSGTGVTWSEYDAMLRLAWSVAMDLERDDATARAAIVNTAMIAFTNGKLKADELEVPDSEEPPSGGDDIPF